MTGCKGDCEEKTQAGEHPNFSGVKKKIMVLSGKGGVGKSSIAASLAVGLADRGYRVGVMDVDFHGPSIPVIFGLVGRRVFGDGEGVFPIEISGNLKVISIGLFLDESDDAVIWRGPMKMTAIRQFIEETHWGDLDYLIIDSPPGTGDEPLSIVQLIPDSWGLIVTTPQELAMSDVRKSINFCKRLNMPVIGLVENMAGLVCPNCGERMDIFGSGGAELLAEEAQIDFLVSLPLDKEFASWADRGGAKAGNYHDLTGVSAMLDLMVEKVVSATAAKDREVNEQAQRLVDEREDGMNIYAIPTENGLLCAHFGHCEKFTLIEALDGREPEIKEVCDAPPHEPGLLPRWLADKGVSTVIAGGMGARAQQIFAESGVRIMCGAPGIEPLEVVRQYMEGALELGQNVCDH